MEVIKSIGFVAGGTVLLLFLSWLLYRRADENIEKIFNWSKAVIILSTLIGLLVWILKVFITFKINEVDYTLIVLVTDVVFALSIFVTRISITKICNRGPHEALSRSIKLQNFLRTQGGFSSTTMILYTIALIGAPLFNLFDIWYLVSTYLLK